VAAWSEDLDQVAIKGSRFVEEVWFLHKPSRTLIVGDLIQVHKLQPGRMFSNAVKRVSGVAEPDGGTSIDIRASFWDRTALRSSVEKLLEWNFDQVVIAHGPLVRDNARAFVARALARALK
jgi:hypothetical protein